MLAIKQAVASLFAANLPLCPVLRFLRIPHIFPFMFPHRDESLQLKLMLGAGATLIAANVIVLAVYLNTTTFGHIPEY